MFTVKGKDRRGFICANRVDKYHTGGFSSWDWGSASYFPIVQGHSASEIFFSREWKDTKTLH